MDLVSGSPDVLAVLLVIFTIATLVAGVAVVVSAVFMIVNRARQTSMPTAAETGERPEQLPLGAEAALNALSELRPDPRNVVVTHRDPTGEVRLQPVDLTLGDRYQRTA